MAGCCLSLLLPQSSFPTLTPLELSRWPLGFCGGCFSYPKSISRCTVAHRRVSFQAGSEEPLVSFQNKSTRSYRWNFKRPPLGWRWSLGGEGTWMGFAPFLPNLFLFARIWLDAKSIGQKCTLKKEKQLQNEAFSGPVRSVCVFSYLPPPLRPPVRRRVSLSFIVFMSRVQNASTHPLDVETSVSSGGRAGEGSTRKAPSQSGLLARYTGFLILFDI